MLKPFASYMGIILIGNPTGSDSNAVAVLQERLPKDMFISPNSITVSSIIGQGRCMLLNQLVQLLVHTF